MMIAKLLAFVRALASRRRAERELDEELRFHIEMETEANLERGVPPAAARRQALIALGGVDQTRERVSQARATVLDSVAQDIRFALRSFRRNPGFAAIVVLTTGVAIGACTTLFGVLDAVLLKALPYRDPDALVMVWTGQARSHRSHNSSYPDFADWRAQSRAFTDLAAFHGGSVTLTGNGDPARLDSLASTPNLLTVLGVQPLLGRPFDTADGLHAAMLGHGLWMRRFGGDRAVVGREVRLDGKPYRVVGVLPPHFHFPPYRFDGEPELFLPLEPRVDRDWFFLQVVGRLRPGLTREKAQREANALAARMDLGRTPAQRGRGINIGSIHSYAVLGAARTSLTLFVAVACVLLIACANVANLLLARGAARQPELAIRAALGAGRVRLARQLLTESLLLAAAGGIVGVIVARWCLPVVMIAVPQRTQLFTRLHDTGLQLDGTVLAFALALSLVTGLAFGVAPALRSVRALVSPTATRATGRLRGSLLLIEVALSFILLTGAGLMIRSVASLVREDPGFRTDRLLTAGLSLPDAKYPDGPARVRFFDRALQSARALPRVEGAALVVNLPLTRSSTNNSFETEGTSVAEGVADFNAVSPGYFDTLGVPLLRGRDFGEADSETAPKVAAINQAMARTYWPGEDPIGKAVLAARLVREETPAGRRVRFEKDRFEIVAIVGDARQLGLDAPPTPAIFFPYTQRPSSDMTLVVRTMSAPGLVLPDLRSAVGRVDADLPLVDARMMDEWVGLETAPRWFLLLLLGGLALLASALAMIGIYGVGAYAVSRQVREIGIRLALGAPRRGIAALVLREHAPWIAGGLVLGGVSSLALTRLLTSYLYGVRPGDGLTLAAVTLALAAAALAAQTIPVRRATRIDPATALRTE